MATFSFFTRPLTQALTAAACLGAVVTTAHGGSIVAFDVTTHQGRGFSQMYVDKGRVAMVQDAMDGHMFYDQASRTVTVIDHAQKSYIVMDEAKLDRMIGMASGVVGAMAAAMEQLKNLPAEQRSAAEQMMKSMGLDTGGTAPAKTITATSEKRRVSGVNCTMHQVKAGASVVSEACIASAGESGIAPADWQTLQSMRGLWIKYAERAQPLLKRFGAGLPDISAVDVEGLPVMIMKSGTPEMMLREIRQASTPGELTTIPAGYVERNLPMM